MPGSLQYRAACLFSFRQMEWTILMKLQSYLHVLSIYPSLHLLFMGRAAAA